MERRIFTKMVSRLWIILLSVFVWTACSEETHEYTAAPEIEDEYIDRLDDLIDKMNDLLENSSFGEKKGQYPVESRDILTDAISSANRCVLLIKYQNPAPSETEKQRFVDEANAAIGKFKSTVRTEDAETVPAELFINGVGSGTTTYIDFGDRADYVNFGEAGRQQFTVEFWVKVTKGGGKDQNVFLSTYLDGNGWMMYWRKDDGGIYRATWGQASGICEPAVKPAPEDGEWQHFVFTYSDTGLPDDASLRARLYVNGEVKATEGNVGGNTYKGGTGEELNKPMTAFGRYMRTGDDNLYEEGFAGYMKNIRIWKTAKNAEYVASSYRGEAEVSGSEEDLVAAWDFTSKPSGSETQILDLTGRHTAKIVGSDYKWERVAE